MDKSGKTPLGLATARAAPIQVQPRLQDLIAKEFLGHDQGRAQLLLHALDRATPTTLDVRMIDAAAFAGVYFKAPPALRRADGLGNALFTQRIQRAVDRHVVQARIGQAIDQLLRGHRAMLIQQRRQHPQARLCHAQAVLAQQSPRPLSMVMGVPMLRPPRRSRACQRRVGRWR